MWKKIRTDIEGLKDAEIESSNKCTHFEEKLLTVTKVLNEKDEKISSLRKRNELLKNTVRQKSDIIQTITANNLKMNKYVIPKKGILKN